MSQDKEGGRSAGRWIGGVIFFVGLGMMGVVFALAVMAFMRVPEALLSGSDDAPLSRPLGAAGVQIGFLFVMAYLSSLFASKGLELFEASHARGRE